MSAETGKEIALAQSQAGGIDLSPETKVAAERVIEDRIRLEIWVREENRVISPKEYERLLKCHFGS